MRYLKQRKAMKIAHELFSTSKETFGECLKKAWATINEVAKKALKKALNTFKYSRNTLSVCLSKADESINKITATPNFDVNDMSTFL